MALKIREDGCGVAVVDNRACNANTTQPVRAHESIVRDLVICPLSRLPSGDIDHRHHWQVWSARTLLAFWFLRWAKTAVVWALVGSMIQSEVAELVVRR